MEPKERETIRRALREKLDSVHQQIHELEAVTRPIAPENAIGRVSRMDAINNKSINDAGLRKARQTIEQLDRALARVDAPDFGTCAQCSRPIPVGRLMLMPHTTRCVACASR